MTASTWGWHPPHAPQSFSMGGARGWHPPYAQRSALQSDESAYLQALLTARSKFDLPKSPPAPLTRPLPGLTDSGPDIMVFLAQAEFAQSVQYKRMIVHDQPVAMTISSVSLPAIELPRPADALLAAQALDTKRKMAGAAANLSEILAQDQEVDRFILSVLNMHATDFPAVHTVVRTALFCANQVCFAAKDFFQVKRPSQLLEGAFIPIVPLPPHSSFPGGHATQTTAVVAVIAELLTGATPEQKMGLEDLATEVTTLRETAGLHYKVDSTKGTDLGKWAAVQFMALASSGTHPALSKLWAAAKAEIEGP